MSMSTQTEAREHLLGVLLWKDRIKTCCDQRKCLLQLLDIRTEEDFNKLAQSIFSFNTESDIVKQVKQLLQKYDESSSLFHIDVGEFFHLQLCKSAFHRIFATKAYTRRMLNVALLKADNAQFIAMKRFFEDLMKVTRVYQDGYRYTQTSLEVTYSAFKNATTVEVGIERFRLFWNYYFPEIKMGQPVDALLPEESGNMNPSTETQAIPTSHLLEMDPFGGVWLT